MNNIKLIRKIVYKDNSYRTVNYENINGTRTCVGDRRKYLDLKKYYRLLDKKGKCKFMKTLLMPEKSNSEYKEDHK